MGTAARTHRDQHRVQSRHSGHEGRARWADQDRRLASPVHQQYPPAHAETDHRAQERAGMRFIPCPPRRTRYRPFSTGTEMVALVSLPCCQRTVLLSETIENENCA